MEGRVIQINVKSKSLYSSTNQVGLPKLPVKSVKIHKLGVGDDYNHYRSTRKNNTEDRAILIITVDKIIELNDEGWKIKYGDLGENFTIDEMSYHDFQPGKVYHLGQADIEITEPCHPCNNLAALPFVGTEKIREFIQTMKGRRGWYGKVLTEGTVNINDKIREKKNEITQI